MKIMQPQTRGLNESGLIFGVLGWDYHMVSMESRRWAVAKVTPRIMNWTDSRGVDHRFSVPDPAC